MARFAWLFAAILAVFVAFMWSKSVRTDPVLSGATVKVLLDKGHGSGVHIGDGYVLTAAHVVNDKPLSILSDNGRVYPATVLWENKARDVALVRMADVHPSMATAVISCRSVVTGEPIRAKGNPEKETFLVFEGYVAGAPRKVGPWASVVPADLTIISGMSGGPVFDARGSVIGLSVGGRATTAHGFPSWSRLTFFVPSSEICELLVR